MLLQDPSILTWIFHDAVAMSLTILYQDDGTAAFHLACKINADENEGKEALASIEIKTPAVLLQFKDVAKYAMSNPGSIWGHEVILSWDVTAIPTNVPYYRHRIRFSATEIEMECGQVQIEEIEPSTTDAKI